jgi:hypothetical protein
MTLFGFHVTLFGFPVTPGVTLSAYASQVVITLSNEEGAGGRRRRWLYRQARRLYSIGGREEQRHVGQALA